MPGTRPGMTSGEGSPSIFKVTHSINPSETIMGDQWANPCVWERR
jgi:hypothetical protein